jgi:tetratricopeptide (TPR) repeat protein
MTFRTAVNRICRVLVLLLISANAMSQGQKIPPAKQQGPTEKEIKAYSEAMGWFKKAEAMIGTPQENTEEQADLFRKAIAIKPDFVEAHFNLGLIYMRQKKLREAAGEFEAIRKIDADFSANEESIHQLLAAVYLELGQKEDAIASVNAGLLKNPKNLRLLRVLAYLQVHSPDEGAAIPTLTAILELDPTDTDARLNLAILYQKQNRFEDALKNYRLVVQINPADFSAHYNLALMLMRQNKLADAAVELEAANRISAGNAELLERLGDTYANLEQLDKAVQAYQGAVAGEPGRAVLLSKLAFALARLKRTAEAAAVLEKSVALDPKSPDAFYLLGDLYAELQKFDESVAAYGRSLKLDPKQKNVHYNLGTLFAESRHYTEARAELKAAIDIDPEYAAAWSNLAVVSEKLELDKEAMEAHEKVIGLGKAGALNYFRLGILYAKGNSPDASIKNFAKAIELEPEKYRQLLREELKNVHSVLDSVRYKDAFVRLVAEK